MNPLALEEQIARLEKEIRFGGAEVEQRFLELRAEVDRVRLELAAIKRFLGTVYPAFTQEFPQILERVIEEVDPEFH